MHYVVSDIHGSYINFMKLLKEIHFEREDIMYIIGDIPSRGKGTFQLLDYVMDTPNIVHIKGNHEFFLEKYIEKDEDMLRNYGFFGGEEVIEQLKSFSKERIKVYHDYLKKLPLYLRIKVNNQQYVLTHSGYLEDYDAIYNEDGSIDITASIDSWCGKSQFRYLISNDLHYIPASIKFDKLIVGHYATKYLDHDGIYFCNRYIDIDNGHHIVSGRKLACLRLEDMQEYYI